MTESNTVLRGEKIANIIACISERYQVTLETATDLFYTSDTSDLIENGISDLQCRSDLYIAQCVWEETHPVNYTT